MTGAGLAFLLAGAAFGQAVTTVRPADIQIKVPIKGTVEYDDVFRLKAGIEGRIEAVLASTFTWVEANQPLGLIAHKELAAIIDARGSTAEELMQERWQKVYKPARILCNTDCFLLKAFVKTRQRVMPNALLFEAARTLRMVGRVEPDASALVQFGQKMEIWPVNEPSRRIDLTVSHYTAPSSKDDAGGTYKLDITSERYMLPGTAWEGQIYVRLKRKVLAVPTSALFVREGAAYLPIRVSTGVSSGGLTEITSGVEKGTEILVVDQGEAASAPRLAPGQEAVERIADELGAPKPAPDAKAPAPSKAAPARPPVGRRAARTPKPEAAPVDEPPAQDEDPYAE